MPSSKPLTTIAQAALAGMALLLSPLDSHALQWSAQPVITAGAGIDDNINLETGPHDTVWNTTLSPQLTLSASSQRSSVNGRAQLKRLDYSGDSSSSHTNGLLNLKFTRLYERSQLSLAGNLNRDSTLESELIATGVVTSRAQRTSRTLAPSWDYSLTERDIISLGYSYLDVGYGDTTTTSHLQDYTSKDPSISLSHAFTEKNKLNLYLSYSDYQSQSPASTTSQYRFTTTSAQLGFSRALTETLLVSITAGMHKTDSRISGLTCFYVVYTCFPIPVETTNSDTGSLFKASLQQEFESSQVSAELSRSLQPTADGGLVQTDRLSGVLNTKLTPTLTGSLNLSIYQSQSSAVSSNGTDRRYYSITPKISWRITEWWSVNTVYARSVSQDENGDEATGNAINLTLNYTWPTISKSR